MQARRPIVAVLTCFADNRRMLPPIVADFFQHPFWLRPEWLPFVDGVDRAPAAPGIYALGLPQGIRYDRGVSCVVYFGAAANLKQRLSYHMRQDHNYHICQLRDAFGQFSVAWWPLPGFDKTWRFTIEGEAMCRFERQFGSIPVCNLAVDYTPHATLVRDFVNIAECSVANPIPLDDLKPLGIRVRWPALIKQTFTANDCFYVDRRPSDEELAAYAEHTAAVDERNRLDNLSTVCDEAVTTWPVAKFAALLRIAQTLNRDTLPSKVIRFQASSRKVPRPHTWGEVAVVQARMTVGAWYPPARVWLKIVYGQELLGQAIMESYFFRGEDKSDLPQRDKPRKRELPNLDEIESRFLQAIAH